MLKESVNSFVRVSRMKRRQILKLPFIGFLLKMSRLSVLRSLRVYILKQVFFSISVNSGRIFTSPLRGSVNILPLFTSISKNQILRYHLNLELSTLLRPENASYAEMSIVEHFFLRERCSALPIEKPSVCCKELAFLSKDEGTQ